MREEVHAISRELQWYNQLVGHVGIHGQRRFTEALVKRSLVYRFGMTDPGQVVIGSYKEGDRVLSGPGQVATGHSKGRDGSGLEGDRVM
ncbi:hypothetical protein Taro_001024 [Colocasia esculenta]|uniref:Uncharacterized protein n=1 Tax=Colocasia esculenta TaxID=4460 RepID=A0A843TGL1_COLES|nr:hypothetical protein [Colocasia esculenta]